MTELNEAPTSEKFDYAGLERELEATTGKAQTYVDKRGCGILAGSIIASLLIGSKITSGMSLFIFTIIFGIIIALGIFYALIKAESHSPGRLKITVAILILLVIVGLMAFAAGGPPQ